MPENSPSTKMKIQCPACGVKLDVSELEPFTQVSCPKCDTRITIPKWFLDDILLEERFFDSAQKTLYRSLEPALDREATVKIVKAGPYSQEELDAFLESARKQATINNPNIASIYSCGMIDEGAYVISQYQSAVDWPCTELQDIKNLLELATSLINAIDEAAKVSLHHGDLCPANILITHEKDLLVTDFGTAVALHKKPGFFAAPEFKIDSPATLEADVYSMGACIYYMATGIIPEKGNIQPIGTLKKGFPPEVAEAIMKMLSPEPAQRPTDLTALAKIFGGNTPKSPQATPRKSLKRSGAVHVKVVRPQKKKGSVLNVMLLFACIIAAVLGAIYAVKTNPSLLPQKSSQPKTISKKPTPVPDAPSILLKSEPSTLPAECIAARPTPKVLDFKTLKEKNKVYLQLVPEDKLEIEKERLRLIGSSLDFLKACMKAGAYDRGEKHPIRLKNGKVIRGIIPRAPNNDNQITIRQPGNKDAAKVAFSDLDFMQIMDIFQFYAEKREEMALGKLTKSIKTEIYAIYLRMALLCDWYNHPEEARKFAGMGLKYRPSMRDEFLSYGIVPQKGASDSAEEPTDN